MLINEFGEIGIDHDLVQHSTDEIVIEMSSGCLCCTIRGELAETLLEAPGRFSENEEPGFNRVIVETTGLADPAPILHTLMSAGSVAERYYLDGVVTTVDAVNGPGTLNRQIESVKQVAVADRLVITKSDFIPDDAMNELRNHLRQLNPGAPQIVAEHGVVDPASLFGAELYDPSTKSLDVQQWLMAEAFADAHDHGHAHNDVNRHDEHIKALCLTFDEPIRGEALDRWLDQQLLPRGEDFLRTKGIINVDGLDSPLVIHGVQHIFHPPVILPEWPTDDRRSRIVFITRDVDESILRDALVQLNTAEKRRPNPLD